jgi:hypothetical protein
VGIVQNESMGDEEVKCGFAWASDNVVTKIPSSEMHPKIPMNGPQSDNKKGSIFPRKACTC